MDFGDEDPVVPQEELDAIAAACGNHPDVEMRIHAGAGHGFSHTGWPGYRPEVMDAAHASLEALLARLRS